MVEQELCRGCKQRNDCQQIYEKLARSSAPSVTRKVILAFLVPLVAFIACLAASQHILADVIEAEGLQALLGLLVAGAVTFGLVLLLRAIDRQLGKRKQSRNSGE
jgi:hypothetical protein